MTLRYPAGLDCVWIATDKDGNLAAFVTGGEGPIPAVALSEDAYLIAEIESAIYELEATSEAKLLVSLPRPDDYVDMAGRGFYVFDWQDVSRTRASHTGRYEKIAIPSIPRTLNVLPVQLLKLVEATKWSRISFDEVSGIDARTEFECSSPD